MPWSLRLITLEQSEIESKEPKVRRVGDMWFAPWMLTQHFRDTLSQHYWNSIKAKPRDPLIIVMPGGWDWCPDRMAFDGKKYSGGWNVEGDIPNITITPSINRMGNYHGWVRDGVITEDCEGRVFSKDGCDKIYA